MTCNIRDTEVLWLAGVWLLEDWNQTGCLPHGEHLPLMQAHVVDLLQRLPQLGGTGL